MTPILAAVLLAAPGRLWGPPERLVTLTSTLVTESSGVAWSRQYPGVSYTHNDRGDTNRIYRFRANGQVEPITVLGAPHVDWEDMASATIDGTHYLYLADIGDNDSNRASVVVYRFVEPAPGAASVSGVQAYTLVYPNGARDAECLVVDPATGDLYVVDKKNSGTTVYRLLAPPGPGTYTLTRLGTFSTDTGGGNPGRRVTAGDANPQRTHVVLRTLTGALEYPVVGAFGNWWRQTPRLVGMPNHASGEAIAYSPCGQWLMTTSEGFPCPVDVQRLLTPTPVTPTWLPASPFGPSAPSAP